MSAIRALGAEACSLGPGPVLRPGQVAPSASRNPLTGPLPALYPGGQGRAAGQGPPIVAYRERLRETGLSRWGTRLEQLCGYLLRPAVAQDRLRLLADGRVVLTLKTAWADGTRHLVFEPLELLEKLAALTPRPRINLVLYHSVLAPHARWRARVVASGAVEAPVPPNPAVLPVRCFAPAEPGEIHHRE